MRFNNNKILNISIVSYFCKALYFTLFSKVVIDNS